ncbi:hypothetical protein [Confluentibacter sediminis]|uniref:hypothetical protein n=1 Tax=Confluentibacter sediminis TaxID=2219045 RepID=UPI000DAEB404|nr:hypothetical protein [Confluentibacter sediminis]
MRHIYYIITFLSLSIFQKDAIETLFIDKTALEADTLVSANNFDTIFYISENILFKKTDETKGIDIGYNNFELGNITSVNTFNPLKINVFYKDVNTVVVLDNRLTEMFKIDFNTFQPHKNVTHISTGSDNTLWVFNQDTQTLELYDYKSNSSRAKTLPVKGNVFDLKSNYNACWLLTKDHLYIYNYSGSLLKKIKNNGFTEIVENNGNLILKKDNDLFYLKDNAEIPAAIQLPNLLINQFYTTDETLYIYDGEYLHKFKLKIN